MRDLVLVLFVALVVVLGGCGSKESQSPIEANGGTANSKPAEFAPAALMRRMVNAYHDMPRYRDQAVMVLSYRRNGQVERETAPMSVAAERPGRVSFSIYQTRMV
ncbi:MAG: hypothetical protein KDA59_02065, partial [Planctomycetales bacterium]|nr:hypothetical protein [Planctomycetales bacterium]